MLIENLIKLEKKLKQTAARIPSLEIIGELNASVQKELFIIYNKQLDKEKWLSREIMSFTSEITIFEDQSEIFNAVYMASSIRFDYINEYLRDEQYQFDLTRLMIDEFDKIAIDNHHKFTFMRFASVFIYNLKKDNLIIELLVKLIDFYNRNQDAIERITIFVLQGFIESCFDEKELSTIKNDNYLIANFMLQN